MTTLSQQQINMFVDQMKQLNSYINTHGQIKRSSVIKHWHDLLNGDWYDLLTVVKELEARGYIDLPSYASADVDRMIDHIENYHSHCDNILFPSPKLQKTLPKRLVMVSSDRSIKSIVFRAMMNIREAYCKMLDIELPNEDSSIGALDPKPRDRLFAW